MLSSKRVGVKMYQSNNFVKAMSGSWDIPSLSGIVNRWKSA